MAAIVAAVQCAAQIEEETELKWAKGYSATNRPPVPKWIAVPILLVCCCSIFFCWKFFSTISLGEEVHQDDHYVPVEEHHSE